MEPEKHFRLWPFWASSAALFMASCTSSGCTNTVKAQRNLPVIYISLWCFPTIKLHSTYSLSANRGIFYKKVPIKRNITIKFLLLQHYTYFFISSLYLKLNFIVFMHHIAIEICANFLYWWKLVRELMVFLHGKRTIFYLIWASFNKSLENPRDRARSIKNGLFM